jgi:hypothetical protein
VWADGSAIVIVWDEDDYAGTAGCCNSPMGQTGYLGGSNVPAIVISSLVTSHVVSTDPYNHYSLLGTIQHLWGFGCLANTCGMTGSQLMTKLFLPSGSNGGGTPEASTPDTGSGDATSTDTGASEAGSSTDAGTGSDTSSTPAPDASDAGTGSEASDAPTGG